MATQGRVVDESRKREQTHGVTASWHKSTGAELATHVVSLGRSLWQQDSGRRAQMRSDLSRYEGFRIASLDPAGYRANGPLYVDGIDGEVKVRWNLCRSLVDAATAKVAGTQQPKVQFVCSNADWRTRRKAPKLDAFVEGLWGTRQEPYADIWELGAHAFRDAAVCQIGFIKTESDVDQGAVVHTKPMPWEVVTDSNDASRGNPKHIWHIYGDTRDNLKAIHPESAEYIDGARIRDPGEDSYSGKVDAKVVERVWVYEWWTLPTGPDSPGKHVKALDSSGAPLVEEKWERTSFPFAIIRWSRAMQGFGGTSLVQESAEISDELNTVIGRMSRSIHLTSMSHIFAPEGAGLADKLADNEDCKVTEYAGMQPPIVQNAAPFGPEHMQWVQLQKSMAFEMTGVSQQSATANKQPGIEAASAIRLVADIQSERFSLPWRAYQSMYVELARHDIACVRELAEADKDFAAKWPGEGFLKTIKWQDADLDDDLYAIRIGEAPSLKGTAADRMQTAQELYAAGMLSQDAFASVQRYKDLPGELDGTSRQRNLVSQYIENWLDATPEQFDSGELRPGVPLFRPPIRWMRLEDALLQVAEAYMQAQMDEAPDEAQDLMLRWIEIADSEIQKREQRMADLRSQGSRAINVGATEAPPMQPQGPAPV